MQAAGPDRRPIDEVCKQFTAAWQSGGRPSVEPLLDRVPVPLRADLLRELVALEVEYRRRRGERPVLGEYQQRFPDHPAEVRAVFAKPMPAVAGSAVRSDAPLPRLTFTLTEGPHKGQSFTFSGHEIFLVGRSKQAHLQITDGYFSRFHFMVEINPPACRLTDLGSRNGTYVNGRRCPSADLHDGDVVKGGQTSLVVSFAAPSVPAADGVNSAASIDTQMLLFPPSEAADEPWPETLPPGATEAVKAPADPGLPQVAGYRLLRELGKGGMGVVYLAEREQDGSRVALKTMIPAVVAEPNQVERFLREARILCQLKHEHIVSFREVGKSQDCLFFAMDYVEGTDAARLLKDNGPLPVGRAARLVCQLLSALDYAHRKNFVHRDIKPANLLVSAVNGKEVAKLADFGLARVYQESQLSGLTMHGEVAGTLAFMPPEQVTQFRKVRPTADQYSAAATFYNLLTGRHVLDFEATPLLAVALLLKDEAIPIRKRRPDLPEDLAGIIHRALAKDPAGRFPDVQAFREALLPFAQGA